MFARARTYVDDPVSGANSLFIVLYNDQGISEIAQTCESLD